MGPQTLTGVTSRLRHRIRRANHQSCGPDRPRWTNVGAILYTLTFLFKTSALRVPGMIKSSGVEMTGICCNLQPPFAAYRLAEAGTWLPFTSNGWQTASEQHHEGVLDRRTARRLMKARGWIKGGGWLEWEERGSQPRLYFGELGFRGKVSWDCFSLGSFG